MVSINLATNLPLKSPLNLAIRKTKRKEVKKIKMIPITKNRMIRKRAHLTQIALRMIAIKINNRMKTKILMIIRMIIRVIIRMIINLMIQASLLIW